MKIRLEKNLKEKRAEFMWALTMQDYTDAQIARIFGVDRTTAKRIIDKKPSNYKIKWVKNV